MCFGRISAGVSGGQGYCATLVEPWAVAEFSELAPDIARWCSPL